MLASFSNGILRCGLRWCLGFFFGQVLVFIGAFRELGAKSCMEVKETSHAAARIYPRGMVKESLRHRRADWPGKAESGHAASRICRRHGTSKFEARESRLAGRSRERPCGCGICLEA